MLNRGITVQELRAFLLAAQLASFTKAADQLGLTQPGLSMAIRQLESKLGASLFDRSRRSTQLSPAGAVLLPSVVRLIENFDHTITGMIDVSEGKVGRVTIACPEGVAARIIAPTMRDFVQQNPGVSVSLFDGDASSVEHNMHARIADFGVTGFWKEHPDFTFEPLTMDRCCVICLPQHEFARRGSVTLEELSKASIVSLNRDAGVRRLLERVCADMGVGLVVRFEVARVSTLLGMVASGLGVSVLTELAMFHHSAPKLVAVPLSGSALTYPVGIITPATRMLTAGAAMFLKALRDHVRTGDLELGKRGVPIRQM